MRDLAGVGADPRCHPLAGEFAGVCARDGAQQWLLPCSTRERACMFFGGTGGGEVPRHPTRATLCCALTKISHRYSFLSVCLLISVCSLSSRILSTAVCVFLSPSLSQPPPPPSLSVRTPPLSLSRPPCYFALANTHARVRPNLYAPPLHGRRWTATCLPF